MAALEKSTFYIKDYTGLSQWLSAYYKLTSTQAEDKFYTKNSTNHDGYANGQPMAGTSCGEAFAAGFIDTIVENLMWQSK